MQINIQDTTWLKQLHFKIITDKFKYLGVHIARKYFLLFEANFPPLIRNLISKIQFWETLPVSHLDRINAIKMIFLQKLLHIFQLVPIYLPQNVFLRNLDSTITNLIWYYKTQRTHKLQFKENGGLALPNFLS